jgi:alpha-galactosidase
MKFRILSGVIIAVFHISLSSPAAVAPSRDELAASRRWASAMFEAGRETGVPESFFSFSFDGRPSTEFLKTWPVERGSRRLDNNRTERTLVYKDPKTGLALRCVGVEDHEYPVVEWTLYFKNTGAADSPILADIQALDVRLERRPEAGTVGGEFLLHHNKGSLTEPSDYRPFETALGPGTDMRITGTRGRPTSSDLCYFNLEIAPDEGLVIALGWPGQIATRFIREGEGHLRIVSGQESTKFKLLPGEEIRSPLVALQFWKGEDWLRAQNVWRRWFVARSLRRPGGKLPPSQWCGANDLGLMEKADEESVKKYVDSYLERGLKPDFWWMDAGWYPCRGEWWNTGTWEPDRSRFPGGLRPVTDYLHSKGIRNILWFEPERVTPGTWLYLNHPEWILPGKEEGLLNMGDPAAWKWVVNRVDELIVSEGVDIYRQDFNTSPLPYWRAGDADDRRGITEIRYVTGLLAYWDELLRRHPDMLYDNCASGGRRNDLESMRRGVPYTKSDYAGEPVGVQCETYGISLWFPYFGATWYTSEDPYVCRSNMAQMIGSCLEIDRKDHLRGPAIPKLLDEWRKTIPNYWGDFWPLTPYSLENTDWMAWQFDRPEAGEGVVQAFRRADCGASTARLRLRGLDPAAVYTLTDFDAAGTRGISGRELMAGGLVVVIKNRPGAAIITYKKESDGRRKA